MNQIKVAWKPYNSFDISDADLAFPISVRVSIPHCEFQKVDSFAFVTGTPMDY
jgi:hypothetical protein